MLYIGSPACSSIRTVKKNSAEGRRPKDRMPGKTRKSVLVRLVLVPYEVKAAKTRLASLWTQWIQDNDDVKIGILWDAMEKALYCLDPICSSKYVPGLCVFAAAHGRWPYRSQLLIWILIINLLTSSFRIILYKLLAYTRIITRVF